MTKFSGSLTGKVNWQTTVSLPHLANHELSLAEVAGPQKCTDTKWKGAIITYWVTSDLVKGSGPQRGYYTNLLPDGDRDWGTLDGKIAASGSRITIKGKWKLVGGTGKFKGIKGSGNYKGRMVSPTELRLEWDGKYQI